MNLFSYHYSSLFLILIYNNGRNLFLLLISMVQFLINNGSQNQYLNFILSVLFIAYNTYYKSYCYFKSKDREILTSMIWLNLLSFLWPCLTQYGNLFSIDHRALLLNIFRGFSSFLNFYLYWACALHFLPLKFVIFAECLNENISMLRQILFGGMDTIQVISRFPYFLYTLILCIKYLWVEGSRSDGNRDWIRYLFWSILLITIPRLIGTLGDHLYYVYGGSGNANLDTLYSSLTILILVLMLMFWRMYRYGERLDLRIGLEDIISLLVRADMRIASYFLNAKLGPLYVVFLDKLGFYLFKLYVDTVVQGVPLLTFVKGYNSTYIFSSMLILIVLLMNNVMSESHDYPILRRKFMMHDQLFWIMIPVILFVMVLNMYVLSIYTFGRSFINYLTSRLFVSGIGF